MCRSMSQMYIASGIHAVFAHNVAERENRPESPRLEVAILFPLRSSGRWISCLTSSLLCTPGTVWATLTRSAPARRASITCGTATGAANKLPPRIAVEVWPEPLSKINSTSSPFFS